MRTVEDAPVRPLPSSTILYRPLPSHYLPPHAPHRHRPAAPREGRVRREPGAAGRRAGAGGRARPAGGAPHHSRRVHVGLLRGRGRARRRRDGGDAVPRPRDPARGRGGEAVARRGGRGFRGGPEPPLPPPPCRGARAPPTPRGARAPARGPPHI